VLGAIPRIRAIHRKLMPLCLSSRSSSRSTLSRGLPRVAVRKIQNLLGISHIAQKIFLPPAHIRIGGGRVGRPPPPVLLPTQKISLQTVGVGRRPPNAKWLRFCLELLKAARPQNRQFVVFDDLHCDWKPSPLPHLGLLNELLQISDVQALPPPNFDVGQIISPDHLSEGPRGDPQVSGGVLNGV